MLFDYKIIAVDFDGTLFEDKWPLIGEPNTELVDYIKSEKQNGSKIILWTCRHGVLLNNAIVRCSNYGITFDAVNQNLAEVVIMFGGEGSPKIYADEYIDDKMCTKFSLPYRSNYGE